MINIVIKRVCLAFPSGSRSLYSAKKGISRDFLSKLQQPIDFRPAAVMRWLIKRSEEEDRATHKYNPDRHATLGPDLATAHFVVGKGGAVLFENSKRWVQLNKEKKHFLPNQEVQGMYLEAADCSNTGMMYESFDNFIRLNRLRYLNLSGCEKINDWCLDRFIMFRDTLQHLVLSGCPNVTERGIASLHRLRNLRILELHDLPQLTNAPLLAIMLEDALPMCEVKGIDYADLTQTMETAVHNVPSFIKTSLQRTDEHEKFVSEPTYEDKSSVSSDRS